MTRWAPWLIALIVWNGAFDLQVRRAGEQFTAEQLGHWRAQAPPALLRDAFTPRVQLAAWRASALAGLVLVGLVAWGRRRAPRPHR